MTTTADYNLAGLLRMTGENRCVLSVPRAGRRPMEFSCSRTESGHRWRTRSTDRPIREYFESPERALADLTLGWLTDRQYEAFGGSADSGAWPDTPESLKILAVLEKTGLVDRSGDDTLLTGLGLLARDHILDRPLGRSTDRPRYRPDYGDVT